MQNTSQEPEMINVTPGVTVQTPEQASIIENLLQNQKKKSEETVTKRFKTLWNKHKVARIATGLALAGGAVAATVTGAVAVAGGLLAARVILGTVGGYMATDAAFDLLSDRFNTNKLENLVTRIERGETIENIEQEVQDIHEELGANITSEQIEQARKEYKRKSFAKVALASTVGLGLGIFGGTHAVETLSSEEITRGVKSKVGDILANKIAPISLSPTSVNSDILIDKPSIKDIFADIKADHPKQGYITLEQTVRRIEGLQQGIDLNHSSSLKSMNSSVHNLVYNPDGKVVEAMKSMNILSEGQSVDSVARKLTEGQIQEIVTKVYGEDLGLSGVIHVTEINSPATNIIENTLSGPIGTVSHPVIEDTPTSSRVPNEVKVLGIIGSVAAFAAGLGWIRSKFIKKEENPSSDNVLKNEDNTSSIHETKIIDKTPSPIQKEKEVIVGEITPVTTPSYSSNTDSDNSSMPIISLRPEISPQKIVEKEEELPESRTLQYVHEIHTMIRQKFGFRLDTENSVLNKEPFLFIFKKSTVGGMFALAYTENKGKGEMRIDWLNGNKVGYTKQEIISTNLSSLSVEDATQKIHSVAKILFKETLLKRDKIKSMELRNLHTIEIESGDLSKIYAQIQALPENKRGCETGGYWFQSCYTTQNGILRFENMQNPTLDEMDISGSSFFINTNGRGKAYINGNRVNYLYNTFDEYEFKYICEIINENYQDGNGVLTMSGAIYNYNWHKHPGAPITPSGSDLNDEGAGAGWLKVFPDMQVFTWVIVNRLPSHINENNKPDNVLILRDNNRERGEDYMLYFSMIRRNERNYYTIEKDLVTLRAIVI